MTVGWTDGAHNAGTSTGQNGTLVQSSNYGVVVGTAHSMASSLTQARMIGITKDPTKSGLVVTFSGLTLGTVASEKLGNFYIHY